LHESCRNSVHGPRPRMAQLLTPEGVKNFWLAGCFTFSTVAQTVRGRQGMEDGGQAGNANLGPQTHTSAFGSPILIGHLRNARSRELPTGHWEPPFNRRGRRGTLRTEHGGQGTADGGQTGNWLLQPTTDCRVPTTLFSTAEERGWTQPGLGAEPMRLAPCGYQRGDCLARHRRSDRDALVTRSTP
jgi:hypothetical protein